MTDEQKPAADTNSAAERSYGIQRIYLKDVSFEAPRSPEVFTEEWKPAVDVKIGTRTRSLGDDLHEVDLTVTVEARQESGVVFLIELHQAGVFAVRGFEKAEEQKILGILCAQNLFPFAREEVANLSIKGGFPQILLQPVNFERAWLESQKTAGQA